MPTVASAPPGIEYKFVNQSITDTDRELSDLCKKAALPPRTKRFLITSDVLDRDKEVVIPGGMATEEYRRNPVMLWAHQYLMPPVGKCVGLGLLQRGRVLYGDFEFAKVKFASEIYELYDGEFLNMVSVGFKTLNAGAADHALLTARPELRDCKRVVSQSNLLEVSCVPIGSNPEALQVAVTKGLIGVETKRLLDNQTSQPGPYQRLRDMRAMLSVATSLPDKKVAALSVEECERLLALVEKAGSTASTTVDPTRPKTEPAHLRRPADDEEDEIDPATGKARKKPSQPATADKPVAVKIRTLDDQAEDIVKAIVATGSIGRTQAKIQAGIKEFFDSAGIPPQGGRR